MEGGSCVLLTTPMLTVHRFRSPSTAQREFQRILENRNVIPLLNELEALLADATRRRDAAGPDAVAPTP